MRLGIAGLLALLCFGGTACYHATIVTGRPASSDSISIPWANSFVYGLVPPPLVDAAAKCPNGVARVETQHSFLNGLVQFITLGIYTPIQIDVTCAATGPVKTSDASTVTPVLKVGEAADSVARLR
ncbi:MAG TPA: Bor family protein, partial [Gemmatimonadaceae bacterium]